MLLVFVLSAPALHFFSAKTMFEVSSTPTGAPYFCFSTFYFIYFVKARTSFACSHYMEIRMVVLDSLKIISINVLFRFFYVVHADKGLVVGKFDLAFCIGMLEPLNTQVGGKPNTRLAHGLYAMLRWQEFCRIRLRTKKFQPHRQRCPAYGLAWVRHVCRSNLIFYIDGCSTNPPLS